MRIRIFHTTSYAYDTPPTAVTQLLRLTPRDHDGQHVVAWRVDISEDCLLHQHEDAFGNIIHSFFHGRWTLQQIERRGRWRSRYTGHHRACHRSG